MVTDLLLLLILQEEEDRRETKKANGGSRMSRSRTQSIQSLLCSSIIPRPPSASCFLSTCLCSGGGPDLLFRGLPPHAPLLHTLHNLPSTREEVPTGEVARLTTVWSTSLPVVRGVAEYFAYRRQQGGLILAGLFLSPRTNAPLVHWIQQRGEGQRPAPFTPTKTQRRTGLCPACLKCRDFLLPKVLVYAYASLLSL